jgi:hypothetical protein
MNFSFLLCRSNVWKEASSARLMARVLGRRDVTVGDVWEALCSASDPDGAPPIGCSDLLSWRVFLEACSACAKIWSTREGSIRTLDLSRHSAESLSCLALEVWASEIYLDLKADSAKFADGLSERRWEQDPYSDHSLVKWLGGDLDFEVGGLNEQLRAGKCPGYTQALYRTLLLLSEVMTTEVLEDTDNPFRKQSDVPKPVNSVATRVWFTTARSEQGEFDIRDPFIPLRLPGRFAIRGDWFLARSQGSSSPRMAERAIDLFSSGTGNIARFDGGIGLPVRREHGLAANRFSAVATGLQTVPFLPSEPGAPIQSQSCRFTDVSALAPGGSNDSQFKYLWRSRLCDYDRHARIWQKWISSELTYLSILRREKAGAWTDGFTAYDGIAKSARTDHIPRSKSDGAPDTEKVASWPSWVRFSARCDELVQMLRASTPHRPR